MPTFYEITENSLPLFENLLTEQAYRSITEDPDVLPIGAVYKNEAAGIMLLKVLQDSILVDYLAVSNALRRRHIATKLLDKAESISNQNDLPLICFFYAKDEEEPLYRLFQTNGAFTVGKMDDLRYRVETKELIDILPKLPSPSDRCFVTDFTNLDEDEISSLLNLVQKQNEDYFNPYDPNYVLPLCLTCRPDEDSLDFGAVLLIKKRPRPDEMELSFLWSHPSNNRAAMELLRAAIERYQKSYQSVRYLYFSGVTEDGRALIEHLFPNITSEGSYYMASNVN